MKNFLGFLLASLLLFGCSVNQYTSSDGTKYDVLEFYGEDAFNKCAMNEGWYSTVKINKPPVGAIADCYQRRQVYQLCNDWDYVYQTFYYNEEVVMLLRNSISQALIRKNENPLKCRNAASDIAFKAKMDVAEANRRANNAEARAAAAEAKAKKAKSQQRQCRTIMETDSSGNWVYNEYCD